MHITQPAISFDLLYNLKFDKPVNPGSRPTITTKSDGVPVCSQAERGDDWNLSREDLLRRPLQETLFDRKCNLCLFCSLGSTPRRDGGSTRQGSRQPVRLLRTTLPESRARSHPGRRSPRSSSKATEHRPRGPDQESGDNKAPHQVRTAECESSLSAA